MGTFDSVALRKGWYGSSAVIPKAISDFILIMFFWQKQNCLVIWIYLLLI